MVNLCVFQKLFVHQYHLMQTLLNPFYKLCRSFQLNSPLLCPILSLFILLFKTLHLAQRSCFISIIIANLIVYSSVRVSTQDFIHANRHLFKLACCLQSLVRIIHSFNLFQFFLLFELVLIVLRTKPIKQLLLI